MATTKEFPFEVVKEGGFPTKDEFGGVITALLDIDEFGLVPLLQRITGPLADAYEGEQTLEWTYAEVGLLSAKANALVELAEIALQTAKRLQEVVADAGEAAENGGRVSEAPRFASHGSGEYEPSQEALERWGLAHAS